MGVVDRVRRLLGVAPPAAALTAPKSRPGAPGPEGTALVRHRPRVVYRGRDWETRRGIALRPEIATKLIWDPGDRERIIAACEAGDFRPLAFFLSALASDDTVQATMGHLCSLLRLPIQWTGDPLLIKTLQGSDPVFDPQTLLEVDPGHPADFWRMHPYPELRRVLWDGRLGGLGLGEYIPQPEGPPRLQHLDLHGLRWEWSAELLSYHSVGEQYTVIAGDRRWLVFTPYGRRRWWDVAPWKACALPYISKQGARLDRLRRQGDLANALHVILGNPQREGKELDDLERFAADDWELDGYIVLQTGGEDAKLVESSGGGFEIFRDGEDSADKAIAKALSGQTVTSTGTTGMNNAGGIWDNISREIIEGVGETLADTLHEQALVPYGKARGRSGLVWVHWDVRSPSQKVADAEAAGKIAEAVAKINAAVQPYGTRLRLGEFFDAQGLGHLPLETMAGQGTTEIYSYDLDGGIVTRNEQRQRKGLPPLADGDETVPEFKARVGGDEENDRRPPAVGSPGEPLDATAPRIGDRRTE